MNQHNFMIPQDSIKISNSANGKARVISVTGINIRLDINVITISTIRRFFEIDANDPDGLGTELTGRVDFPAYEHQLIANNDNKHQCNPTNGLICYWQIISTTNVPRVDSENNPVLDENGIQIIDTVNNYGWKDALGTVVNSPIGLFDFFKPFLNQPIAIMGLVFQNITAEDQVYKTWDK